MTSVNPEEELVQEIIILPDAVYTRKGVKLYGTLYRYSKVCERQLWMQMRKIGPDPDNDLLLIGKLIHEEFFPAHKKEIWLHGTVVDVILEDGGNLLVMEIKRKLSMLESYALQLGFYLFLLRYKGLEPEGVLSFPEERSRITISWSYELASALKEATTEIERIGLLPEIPPLRKKPWCKTCAYKDLCLTAEQP